MFSKLSPVLKISLVHWYLNLVECYSASSLCLPIGKNVVWIDVFVGRDLLLAYLYSERTCWVGELSWL